MPLSCCTVSQARSLDSLRFQPNSFQLCNFTNALRERTLPFARCTMHAQLGALAFLAASSADFLPLIECRNPLKSGRLDPRISIPAIHAPTFDPSLSCPGRHPSLLHQAAEMSLSVRSQITACCVPLIPGSSGRQGGDSGLHGLPLCANSPQR